MSARSGTVGEMGQDRRKLGSGLGESEGRRVTSEGMGMGSERVPR